MPKPTKAETMTALSAKHDWRICREVGSLAHPISLMSRASREIRVGPEAPIT
jgi:hypothetical protein